MVTGRGVARLSIIQSDGRVAAGIGDFDRADLDRACGCIAHAEQVFVPFAVLRPCDKAVAHDAEIELGRQGGVGGDRDRTLRRRQGRGPLDQLGAAAGGEGRAGGAEQREAMRGHVDLQGASADHPGEQRERSVRHAGASRADAPGADSLAQRAWARRVSPVPRW